MCFNFVYFYYYYFLFDQFQSTVSPSGLRLHHSATGGAVLPETAGETDETQRWGEVESGGGEGEERGEEENGERQIQHKRGVDGRWFTL